MCAGDHAFGTEQVAEIAGGVVVEGDILRLALVVEGKGGTVGAHEEVQVAVVLRAHPAQGDEYRFGHGAQLCGERLRFGIVVLS